MGFPAWSRWSDSNRHSSVSFLCGFCLSALHHAQPLSRCRHTVGPREGGESAFLSSPWSTASIANVWDRPDSNRLPAEWITPLSATVSGSFISTALPLSYRPMVPGTAGLGLCPLWGFAFVYCPLGALFYLLVACNYHQVIEKAVAAQRFFYLLVTCRWIRIRCLRVRSLPAQIPPPPAALAAGRER